MNHTPANATANASPIEPGLDARGRFITRVYVHVLAAILALVAFEVAFFRSGLAADFRESIRGVPWILILGGFMIVGWMARRVAWKLESRPAQYAALGAYIVAKGLIISPLLYRADRYAPGAIHERRPDLRARRRRPDARRLVDAP